MSGVFFIKGQFMIICQKRFASFCISVPTHNLEKRLIVDGLIEATKHAHNQEELAYTLSELNELNNFIQSSLSSAGVYDLYPDLRVALCMDVIESGHVMYITKDGSVRASLSKSMISKLDVNRADKSENNYDQEFAELSECKFVLNELVTFAVDPSNKVTSFRVNDSKVRINTWQCGHNVFDKLEDVSILNELNALLCEAT